MYSGAPHLNPKIEILHGRAMIYDNYFTDDNNTVFPDPKDPTPWRGTAIHVGPDAGDVMVCNNMLEGNTIHDESRNHLTVECN